MAVGVTGPLPPLTLGDMALGDGFPVMGVELLPPIHSATLGHSHPSLMTVSP